MAVILNNVGVPINRNPQGFDKSNPYSTNCVGATFTPLEIPPREFLTSISNGVYGRPKTSLSGGLQTILEIR